MKRKYYQTFLEVFWFIIGLAKIVAVVLEVILNKVLISFAMEELANNCFIGFYANIMHQYFVPNALLFIFLAGLIELISSILLLWGKDKATFGLIGLILVLCMYIPLHDGITLVFNCIFLVSHIWLLLTQHKLHTD